MDYIYSTILDPKDYETEGLCDGIELRRNKNTQREDSGAIRAHHDWAKYVGPCCEYRGTLGPVYSFMTVCVPECIPDRLELIAYANEFAFMHDGKIDTHVVVTVSVAHYVPIDLLDRINLTNVRTLKPQCQCNEDASELMRHLSSLGRTRERRHDEHLP